MVSANQALQAGADIRIAIVLAQLDRLVQGAITISEIRCLWSSEMDAEAFRAEVDALEPVKETAVREYRRRAQRRDDYLALELA